MKLKTVAIDRGGQKVLINQKDFDPDGHVLWGEKKPVKASDSPVEGFSNPEPDEWSELAEKLVEAGERKPHPNTKLETLREKVADL